MSEHSPDLQADSLHPDQVAQFLRDHPDFFVAHTALLADLQVPHENGGAVSLVERQVSVLRERNVELRERLNGLLSIARDNDLIFGKTRALMLALLEADDLAALVPALSRSLLEDFGMAAMSLTLFNIEPDALPAQVRAATMADAEAQIGGLLKGQRIVCGVLRPEELRWIFGDGGNGGAGADAVGSAAIVPLIFHGVIGLLSIGARDPQHFRSGMDTLFVNHIGEVLARRLFAMQSRRGLIGQTRAGSATT